MAAGVIAAHQGVTVKFDGTPTSMTAEPMSQITGKYYRVTNAAKRCFDWRQNLNVLDNGVAVAAANIEFIDYLNGIVKFAASYTVNGPVTVTGTYLPLTTLGVVKSFDSAFSPDLIDKSVFGNAHSRVNRGLCDYAIDLGQFDHLESAAGVETLEASLQAGTVRLISIECLQDGSTLANGGIVIRALVVLSSVSTDADPTKLVESGLKLDGSPTPSTNAAAAGPWPVSWIVLDGASGLYV